MLIASSSRARRSTSKESSARRSACRSVGTLRPASHSRTVLGLAPIAWGNLAVRKTADVANDQRGYKTVVCNKIVLRVFCHAYGDRKVLVLSGYDKGRSPASRRQQREIEIARSRLVSWRASEVGPRKRSTGRRKR